MAAKTGADALGFDRRLKLKFLGSQATTHAGLPAYRELDEAFAPSERSRDTFERLFGQLLSRGFGDVEVDQLGHGYAVKRADQDVGGLQIAVDDPFLTGMLNGPADEDEQF